MVSNLDVEKIFLRLIEVGSPSGFEEPMIRRLKKELEPYMDELHESPRGNVIGVQKGSDPESPSIALVAHMDQVGFIVSNIDERGFIRFRRIGGAAIRSIQGQHVRILAGKGDVLGVVGVKPGHLTSSEEERKIPSIEDMYVDVGGRNKEEVESMGISIGTPMVWNTPPIKLANGLVSSAAVDDRAGLTVLIAVADTLREVELHASVFYVGTVEEEIGLRGAGVALFDQEVEMAVAVDTFPAGWQPDINMRDVVYEVGKGPAIHVGEFGKGGIRIHHHKLREYLIQTAEHERIPYQSGMMHGGTDASAMMQSKSGIPAVTMGVPRRYSHTPVEVFDLKDLQNLVKILVSALKKIDKDFYIHRT
jgi:endoglucanase